MGGTPHAPSVTAKHQIERGTTNQGTRTVSGLSVPHHQQVETGPDSSQNEQTTRSNFPVLIFGHGPMHSKSGATYMSYRESKDQA